MDGWIAEEGGRKGEREMVRNSAMVSSPPLPFVSLLCFHHRRVLLEDL